MAEKDLSHQAEEFARRYRDRVRYVVEWERWIAWDGMRWKIDQQHGRSLHLAAELRRDWGFKDKSNAHANEVRVRSEAMAGIRVSFAELDTHDTLLNTHAGVLDVPAGVILPHDPELLLTNITACGIGSPRECPTWKRFLGEYCCGDQELIRYRLGLIGGEWMLGGNRPQKLWFDRGPGGSGKSTFNSALAAILGDYATERPGTLIECRDYEPHSTEIASLYGKRLLVISELERGRALAISKFKRITGDATFTARRMREDEWSFRCLLSPVVCCNDLPPLDCPGKAEWRRFEVLPAFASPATVDYDLRQKLIDEGPAFLAVLAQSGKLWRQERWNRPRAVELESRYYQNANDSLGAWIRCATSSEGEVSGRSAHASYESWCHAAALTPLSEKAFCDRLRNQWGYQRRKARDAAYYQGISILPPDQWKELED